MMGSESPSPWTSEDQLHSTVRNRDFAPGPYLRGGLLGSGGWSSVYKVRRVRDGAMFAGKVSKATEQLRKEASVLTSLNHEHIIKYIDWYEDPATPLATLLVTELCLGGTLQTKIDNSPHGTGRKETLQVIIQCSQALKFVHAQNLVHCDIKPRNILIRAWNPINVAIADCADIQPVTFSGKVVGTQAFWSPYIAQHSRYEGTSDDIWALGITLLGMLAQRPQVRTKEELKKYPKICFEHAQVLKELNKDDAIVHILNRMLVWQAEGRATAAECVDLATFTATNERHHTSKGDVGNNELGIKSPEDFCPISFW